jgi:hypothetical protein
MLFGALWCLRDHNGLPVVGADGSVDGGSCQNHKALLGIKSAKVDRFEHFCACGPTSLTNRIECLCHSDHNDKGDRQPGERTRLRSSAHRSERTSGATIRAVTCTASEIPPRPKPGSPYNIFYSPFSLSTGTAICRILDLTNRTTFSQTR